MRWRGAIRRCRRAGLGVSCLLSVAILLSGAWDIGYTWIDRHCIEHRIAIRSGCVRVSYQTWLEDWPQGIGAVPLAGYDLALESKTVNMCGGPDFGLIVDLPLCWVLAGVAVPTSLLWFPPLLPRARRRRRVARGLCPWCAYDLDFAHASGCPECGWNRPSTPTGPIADETGTG